MLVSCFEYCRYTLSGFISIRFILVPELFRFAVRNRSCHRVAVLRGFRRLWRSVLGLFFPQPLMHRVNLSKSFKKKNVPTNHVKTTELCQGRWGSLCSRVPGCLFAGWLPEPQALLTTPCRVGTGSPCLAVKCQEFRGLSGACQISILCKSKEKRWNEEHRGKTKGWNGG